MTVGKYFSKNLNWPNSLTILRIILAVIVIWAGLKPELWAKITAGSLFTIAALTDFVDGHLARQNNTITTLGKILDPFADKLLMLGSFSVLSYLGMFPWWILVPIVFREVTVTILRFYFLKQGVAVAAVKSGKQKTIMQVTAISFVFAYYLYVTEIMPHWLIPADGLIENLLYFGMYATLLASLYLTLYSGYIFLQNNRHLFSNKTQSSS